MQENYQRLSGREQETCQRGLRERRREQTWTSIHETAASLAHENGVRQTTAEQIADQAEVSARTFFNYFATKEDAILGLRTPRMSEEILASVGAAEGRGELTYAAQLLERVLRDSFPSSRWEQVRQLVHEHDGLRRRMKIHMLACEKALQEFLVTADGQEHRERVRATVMLAAAVLRHIDFGAGMDRRQTDAAITRTVALFQEIVEETA